MKRALSILLCLMMVLAIAACGESQPAQTQEPSSGGAQGGSSAAAAPEETPALVTGLEQNVVEGISEDAMLTIALEQEPPFIMPSTATAGNPSTYVSNCYQEQLFEYDLDTGTVYGRLAENYEWIDDLHFRVKLRDEAKFANGDDVTAEDAVYSWKLSITLSGGSSIYNPDGIKVIDNKNFEVELLNPYANGAEESMARRGPYVWSKKAMEALGYPDEQPLQPDPNIPHGSGKFLFKEWVPGQYIMLERNENYWNKDELPYYKYFKFVFVVDPAARAMAVESGDADVASYVTASIGKSYEGSDIVTPYYLDTGLANAMIMNTGNPENPDSPLKNEKVREAIWLLLDAQAVNDLANAGKGTPCETLVSPRSWVYKPYEGDRTVNIERAKELLAEAGYPDGFTIKSTNIPTQKAQGEVVKECLRLGGIEWDMTMSEIPAHFAKLRTGVYDILILSYNACDFADAIYNNDGRLSPTQYAGMNIYTGDPVWAEIADRCYYEHDPELRKQAYWDAQDYMLEHYMCVGFCTTVRLELVRKGISAPKVNSMGTVYYQDMRPLA